MIAPVHGADEQAGADDFAKSRYIAKPTADALLFAVGWLT